MGREADVMRTPDIRTLVARRAGCSLSAAFVGILAGIPSIPSDYSRLGRRLAVQTAGNEFMVHQQTVLIASAIKFNILKANGN